MNCRNARKQAALYAGGDLPGRHIPNLMKHLESCGDCAADFESLKRTRNMVREIAQKDIPEPLSADFAQTVIDRVSEKPFSRPQRTFKIADLFRNHSAAAFAAAAVVVILYLGVSHIMLERKVRIFAKRLEEIQEMVTRDRAEVQLSSDFLSSRSIEGPIPLGEWTMSDTPSLFAVLHKPDPVNKPDTYIIDYMGDTSGPRDGSESWIEQNCGRILSRAGSTDNIYIAVYYMPGSSESQRMRIAGFLIHKHKPYFNNGV